MYSCTNEFRSINWPLYDTEEIPQINMQKRYFNESHELAFFSNTTPVTDIIPTGLLLKNCDPKRTPTKNYIQCH